MSPAAAKEMKEESDESKSKAEKRKKSDGSSKSEKEPSSKQIKVKEEPGAAQPQPANLYQDILEMEARESETRSASSDQTLWMETCAELRGMMKEIFDLKMKKSQPADIQEKRIHASLLFVTLKKLNRLEKLRLKSCRDATNSSKQSVDSFNLQLQNLLYEVLHLRKEVDKCINFRSADESLTLVPEDQFYKEAPAELSGSGASSGGGGDPGHALRLARLQWELGQRKVLGEEARTREEQRDSVETGVRQKEERGRQLQPQLNAILTASLPVQRFLGMEMTRSREQHKLASLLPKPLLSLFTQVSTLCESSDSLVSVEVEGEEVEAKKVREEQAKGEESQPEEDCGEQDSVDKDVDTENDGRAGKKRRGKGGKEQRDQETSKLLSVFPLSVKLTLSLVGREEKMCLAFGHLPHLDVVSVSASLNKGSEEPRGLALDASTLLASLPHELEEDLGHMSPSPACGEVLVQHGLKEPLSSLLASDSSFPRIYLWAQHLCGLEARGEGYEAVTLEVVLRLLRERLAGRLALQSQLDSLGKVGKSCSLALLLPPSCPLPGKVVARLKSWAQVDWETYSAQEATKLLVAARVVSEHDLMFKALVVREKCTLAAFVSLSPCYPAVKPVFALSLSIEGVEKTETLNLSNSETMRLLEAELNTCDISGCEDVISQLHRVMLLLDIVVEGLGRDDNSEDSVRGRLRSFRFVFNSETKTFEQM